jgi:hypothetical protein
MQEIQPWRDSTDIVVNVDAMTSSSVVNDASSTVLAAHFETGALAAAPALNAAKPRGGPIYSLPDESLAQICGYVVESSRNDSFESQLAAITNLALTDWKRIVPIAFGQLNGQLELAMRDTDHGCRYCRDRRTYSNCHHRRTQTLDWMTSSPLRVYVRHLRVQIFHFSSAGSRYYSADQIRTLKRHLIHLETLRLDIVERDWAAASNSNSLRDLEDWLDIFGQTITSMAMLGLNSRAARRDPDAFEMCASRITDAMRRAPGLKSLIFPPSRHTSFPPIFSPASPTFGSKQLPLVGGAQLIPCARFEM